MKKTIQIIKEKSLFLLASPLIMGSAITVATSNFANLFHFLFQVFMSRNLSDSDFGTLTSLISLAAIPASFSTWVVPTLINFGAKYFAKNELGRVRGLYTQVMQVISAVGLVALILIVIFRFQIGSFFKIHDGSLIVLLGVFIFIGLISVINTSLLQAKLAFKSAAYINLLGALVKILLGILFVFMSFKAAGAMWAYVLSALVPYFASFIPLKSIFQKGLIHIKISTKELLVYGGSAALSTLGTTLLISTDIILVKHFFDPVTAGNYARLSLMGKVIFFFSAPIANVMFPIVTQKFANEEDFRKEFKLALLAVGTCSIAISIFYFAFPQFVISIFSKNNISGSFAQYVGLFSLFMTFYSLVFVLMNFYLSVGKTKVYIPILLAAALQALGIWLYHSKIMDIVVISTSITCLLLISLLIYYWKIYEEDLKI